jgi:hypothetical protein
MVLRAALVATVALTCLVGCGDDPQPETTRAAPAAQQRLTGDERRAAEGAVTAIRRYCRRVARYLAAGGRPPPQGRAIAGGRGIARIAAAKPSARYRGSQTIRDLAADLAEDLEGTNCSRRLVTELERGLGP